MWMRRFYSTIWAVFEVKSTSRVVSENRGSHPGGSDDGGREGGAREHSEQAEAGECASVSVDDVGDVETSTK